MSTLCTAIFFSWLIDVFQVRGNSMSTNYPDGSYIVCVRKDFFRGLSREDMVVFHILNGNGHEQLLIKKIIGIPDDTIQEIRQDSCSLIRIISKEGEVKRIPLSNGEQCASIYSNKPSSRITEYTLRDEYFVLGTNHVKSVDSRNFGPIKKGSVRAKVIFSFKLVNFSLS